MPPPPRLWLAAVLVSITVWPASGAQAVLSVIAETDVSSVHVGDTAMITVRSVRSVAPEEDRPIHAALEIGPEWQAGLQSAESEVLIDSTRVKTWQFRLTALQPGKSSITPLVLIASAGTGGEIPTDKVLGPPIHIEILPARPPSQWPRVVVILTLAGTLIGVGFQLRRTLLRRRAASRQPQLSPLAEALGILGEVHANCREDRAARFFTDVEGLLRGYLSRRLGRALRPAATGPEIVAVAAHHVTDPTVLRDLGEVLQQCTTGRFSGARVGIETLADTEDLTLSVLERLDAAWVREPSVNDPAKSGGQPSP